MTATFTAYCLCITCCGPSSKGINAAGQRPQELRSIAAPRSVPLGTRVLVTIPGTLTNVFVVDDRTARRFDGRWDVYMGSHKAALNFGKQTGTIHFLK